MINGYERLTSRRAWFVPDISVWGLAGIGEVYYLVAEQIGAGSSVLFGRADVGQADQELVYAQLSDHRGNQLPATIDAPRVIPRNREPYGVFVIGEESGEGVRVARPASAPGPVKTDLLILEMGE
jgi:hypothetical protein